MARFESECNTSGSRVDKFSLYNNDHSCLRSELNLINIIICLVVLRTLQLLVLAGNVDSSCFRPRAEKSSSSLTFLVFAAFARFTSLLYFSSGQIVVDAGRKKSYLCDRGSCFGVKNRENKNNKVTVGGQKREVEKKKMKVMWSAIVLVALMMATGKKAL